MKLKGSCMVWALALIIMAACNGASYAGEKVATRFGVVSISDANVLLVNGKPTSPVVEGNNSLSIVKQFSLSDADVVLVQDNGGMACPAEYYFVSLSQGGAKVSKSFGTCSDRISTSQAGNAITVKMPGFGTNKKAGIFVFQDGVLSQK